MPDNGRRALPSTVNLGPRKGLAAVTFFQKMVGRAEWLEPLDAP
jgi:hypothetical protein